MYLVGTYILCYNYTINIFKILNRSESHKNVDYILIKTLEINGLKSSLGILLKSRKITGDSMLIITCIWASSGKACMGQKQI